jgi:divinyl protochlorophyllide a 8-vinyl-reductase
MTPTFPAFFSRTHAASPPADLAARIGPNAVTQLHAALIAAGLEAEAVQLFSAAGAADWLADPPAAMVDERRVARLHRLTRTLLPAGTAEMILTDAGERTANYILANRIPSLVQTILKLLPAPLAAKALASAISAHAWTFAGSGRFSVRVGKPLIFEIAGNPLCAGERPGAPVCAWHAAVFQRLFQALVSRRAQVIETDCEARGDACCRFALSWDRRATALDP